MKKKIVMDINNNPRKPIYPKTFEKALITHALAIEEAIPENIRGKKLKDYTNQAVIGLGGIPLRETYSHLPVWYSDWERVQELPINSLLTAEALFLALSVGWNQIETIEAYNRGENLINLALAKLHGVEKEKLKDSNILGRADLKVGIQPMAALERKDDVLFIGPLIYRLDGTNLGQSALIIKKDVVYTSDPFRMLHPRLGRMVRQDLLKLLERE